MKTGLTRNEDRFVRNHGGIPIISKDDCFLEIGGLVNQPNRLTMADIFPRQSAIVMRQCTRTRRIEQLQEYPGGERRNAIPRALC